MKKKQCIFFALILIIVVGAVVIILNIPDNQQTSLLSMEIIGRAKLSMEVLCCWS